MKKKLLLLYFLVATCVVNAQNVGIGTSSPAAKLQVSAGDASFALFGPNSTYGGSLYVGAGTDHSAALTAQVFVSDGNLHLDPASGKNIYMGYFQPRDIYLDPLGGNVGIGTSTPQKNLSVQNGMNVDQADGNFGSVVNGISFGNNSGEGIGSKRYGGGNQWGLDFYTGAINRMSITNSGNVGIGTTNPQKNLSVQSGMNIDQEDGNNGTSFHALTFGNNSAEGIGSKRNAGLNQYGLDFFTASATRMSITNGGNVGIGTISPGEKLTIVSADNNSVTNIGAFYPFNLSQGIGIGYDEIRKIGTSANSNLFINAKGSGNLILENSATGNVGIGTISPAAKLQVSAGDASLALFGPNSFGGQLYIGATPINQTSASSAQVIASDGNLHIDPASGKNIYMGYFQARDIYLNPTGGKVGIGTASPATTLEVNGYTKLGNDAPSIKVKKFTGTTAAAMNGSVYINFGISSSKVLSLSVFVAGGFDPGGWIEEHWTGYGYNFFWELEGTGVVIFNANNDSANILSKPIAVLITYEE